VFYRTSHLYGNLITVIPLRAEMVMALHTTEILMSSPGRSNLDAVVSAKTIGRANIGACHGDTKALGYVSL
jgi:hypothetical protein